MSDTLNIPIFPLNNVILFPKTNLPLNIFEKRYLDMINFAFSTNKKIGMIQSNNINELYKIGCIGKIISYEETSDGRYLINLIGEDYFLVLNELKTANKFRSVKAKIYKPINIKSKKFEIEKNTKDIIIKKYFIFSKLLNQKLEIDFLSKIDNETLIKFIAMSSPFTVAEKQMLLETYDLKSLMKKILTLFDYYSANEESKESIN